MTLNFAIRLINTFSYIDNVGLIGQFAGLQKQHNSPTWLRETIHKKLQSHLCKPSHALLKPGGLYLDTKALQRWCPSFGVFWVSCTLLGGGVLLAPP